MDIFAFLVSAVQLGVSQAVVAVEGRQADDDDDGGKVKQNRENCSLRIARR